MKTQRVHRIQCYCYQPSAFTCLAKSNIGLIAAGREDGAIEVYDERRGFVMVARFPQNLIKSAEALGWSEDGRLFCTGSSGCIHELDLTTLSIKHSTLLTGSAVSRCLVVLDTHILVGNDEGFITLFSIDASSLTEVQIFPQLTGKVLAIAAQSLNSVKSLIAASTDSGSLVALTYTKHSASVRHVLLTESVSTTVWALLFVRTFLFSGDNCGNVRVWNPRTGGLIQSFPSHVGLVLTLTMSDDAMTVFSGGSDATVRKYSRVSFDPNEVPWELGGILRGCRRDIRGLVYLPGLSFDPETEARSSDSRFEPHRLLAVGLDARLQLLSCNQAESVPIGPARAHTTLGSLVGRPRDGSSTGVIAHVAALPFWPYSITPGRSRPAQYATDSFDSSRWWCLLHYPEKLVLLRLAQLYPHENSISHSNCHDSLVRTVWGPLQLAEIRPKFGSEFVCCAINITRVPLIAYSDLNRTCVLKISCSNPPRENQTKTKVRIERVTWKRHITKYSRRDSTVEHPVSPDNTTDTDTNEDDDSDELTAAVVARYFDLDDNVPLSPIRTPVGGRKRSKLCISSGSDPGFSSLIPRTDRSKSEREMISAFSPAICLAFTPDALSMILVTRMTYELCAVSLDTGRESWRCKLTQDNNSPLLVYAISVSPEPIDPLSYLIALACSDGRVRLYSSLNGKLLFTCPRLISVSGHAPYPARLAFAPTSNLPFRLAIVYTNNQLTEWLLTQDPGSDSSPDDKADEAVDVSNTSWNAGNNIKPLRGQLNSWLTTFWNLMGDEFSTVFGVIHSLTYSNVHTWLLASDRYLIHLSEGMYSPGDIHNRVTEGAKPKSNSCFSFTPKFESIIQADALNENELAVVSVHSASIAQQLSAPLQRKLFGL